DLQAAEPTSVVIVQGSCSTPACAAGETMESAAASESGHEPQPGADQPASNTALARTATDIAWPGAGWERNFLQQTEHPFFPKVIDFFCRSGVDYLIEERPAGRPLWDAWDDPSASDHDRFDWLRQIAVGLDQVHCRGAILESLRPEAMVVGASGHVRL